MKEFSFSDSGIIPTTTINTKGLNCPLPLLVTKKKLNGLSSGQSLQVDSTDSDSLNDISKWCRRVGHTYLGAREGFGYMSFFIKKG